MWIYGEFIATRVDRDPYSQKGYVDVGLFKLNALALGVGYAQEVVGSIQRWRSGALGTTGSGRQLCPNEAASQAVFDSAGTTILYYADSARTTSNKLTPFVFDFGTQFRTGYKSLVFGMSVRNFSRIFSTSMRDFSCRWLSL